MVTKRIIPCLDIKSGRTVKGTNFVGLRDMGDPVELARRYSDAGADELVFLDISATDEERSTTLDVVQRVAQALSIPFTVGGGISSIKHVSALLDAGADKVSINSSAVRRPELIDEIAKNFGSQCCVVAVDSRRTLAGDEVVIQAGKIGTGLQTIPWVQQVAARGAGEILLTSIDNDGVRTGFAVELTRAVSRIVGVPVIASGGAGQCSHFVDVFEVGQADGALAAGIFHEGLVTVGEVKRYLREKGLAVRI